eukprot:NODE_19812_length_826_cov_4.905579.p5 GENE.NODE_19812_length_826_cov_4.905579~~NODE_19812_length_826_cov_4.905579.p5  ORF type:complete len:76 (+),score=6.61 NODE_19812_length_826_cov_4.905579:67-294(+)
MRAFTRSPRPSPYQRTKIAAQGRQNAQSDTQPAPGSSSTDPAASRLVEAAQYNQGFHGDITYFPPPRDREQIIKI